MSLTDLQGERSGCTEDVEVFPSKSLKPISHQIWQYGDRNYHAKVRFRPTEIQGVLTLWRLAAPSATKKRATSLCFSFHFQCWSNTLYTTLTSRAIKKEPYAHVHFNYTCLLPYRWQYQYLTTVLPAYARNVFYGRCSVFI